MIEIKGFKDDKLAINHKSEINIDLASFESSLLELNSKVKYKSESKDDITTIIIEFKKDDLDINDIINLIDSNKIKVTPELTEDDYFDERVKASLIRLGVIKEK